MAKKIFFVTGGARSGKSSFAEGLANGMDGKRAYIATARALDPEMASRIEQHKKERNKSWDTIEEPVSVADRILELNGRYKTLLLDCLTLWLSNNMELHDDASMNSEFDRLIGAVKGFDGDCIIVSNEVGLGIVPDNPLARRFRDLAGILNQKTARAADEAYFMASGMAIKLK